MSHFFTIVILPNDLQGASSDIELDTSNIDSEIERLMAPYNENIRVPEYERKCWCVGKGAEKEARNEADRVLGNLDTLRATFHNRFSKLHEERGKLDNLESQLRKDRQKDSETYLKTVSRLKEIEQTLSSTWGKEISDPREKFISEFMENHPDKDKKDPECTSCNKAGMERTDYNPKSKWDWYRIGGRWDGEINATPNEDEDGGFNFGNNHETKELNTATVDKILSNKILPFALITPDGEWHQRGQMGWWGIVSGETSDTDWQSYVLEVYEKFKDHIAIGLDCHI